ncbi:TetR/AcrR family transcriptional regulator [Streptomyces sp. NPDC020792]|uniref:TetR/AcrR family transcriptional regulator n=1 Tax=Streptomyces sp. NPDC020792 TaxID=3365089 RepID=UPI0037945334
MPPATPKTKSGRRPRGSITAEAILEAAFAYAEEESLDALSMPKLAARLGIGVTSLYWYYRSKEELFEAMRDQAAADFLSKLPDYSDLPWDEHCRRYFREMRRIFQENTVLCDFFIFRDPLSALLPPRELFLSRIDREVSMLLAAGFEPAVAARGYMAMSVYTQGCVQKHRLFHRLHEASATQDSGSLWQPNGSASESAYPGLAETYQYWSTSFAADADFEEGLDNIIEGLRSKLRGADKPPARKKARPRKTS